MKRFSCLVFCVLAAILSGTDGLHQHIAGAAASAPSVSIRRVNALNDIVQPGDFNGDGIVDLVASAPRIDAPPRLVIVLGKGDGSFGTATTLPYVGRVLNAADVNNDGKLDLLVADDPGSDAVVSVLFGSGNGTFPATQSVNSFDFPQFALAADLNGDGFKDIVVGDDGGFVQIYPGRADGTYPDIVSLTTGPGPRGGAVADLNGDGKPDLAVANHDGHSLSIFLNRGALAFTPADFPLDRQANDVVAADVNRDGKMDLLVAASHDGSDDLYYIDGFVYVLLGNGSGTFAQPVQYEADRGAWRIVVGDFNRDGIPDVATGNHSAKRGEDICGFLWDTVSVLPGNLDGTFGTASSFSLGDQTNLTDFRFRDTVRSLAAVDVNGDGWRDLVASSGAVLINQAPDPNWAPKVTASATAPDADHSITLQAVASDVDQDALSYQWTESGGQWIEPTATPCRFTPTTGGVHTFTVTVDDRHGHAATSSVSVDFGSIGGGGSGTPPAVSVTAPAAGGILDEARPYTIRWTTTSSSTVTGLSVSLSTDDGGHFQPISECAALPGSATSCTWHSVEPVTSYGRIAVTATDSAGLTGTGRSGRFTVRAAPGGTLTYGWSHADVGQVGAAGSASHDGFRGDGQALTVSGSGADIWGSADAFHFVWQRVTGDFSIDTRVDSLQNTNAWAKAGLMIRAEATDPMSVHASIFVSPSKGVAYQRRTVRSAGSTSTQGPVIAVPAWLRMTRQGNLITALYRQNQTDGWTVLGRQVIDAFGPAVDVGLPVTSHADGAVATAVFSGVFLGPLPNMNLTSIGGALGGFNGNGTTFLMEADGTDIWGTADSFLYAWLPIGGNRQITVRIRSIGAIDPWSKAGVMIRESLAAGSKQVDAIVSSSKGIAMQYRGATNGPSASAVQVSGTAPVWLRIRRFESATPGEPAWFQAQYSTTGTLWRLLSNSVNFTIARDSLVGIAVTSHHAGVKTQVILDDIRIEP